MTWPLRGGALAGLALCLVLAASCTGAGSSRSIPRRGGVLRVGIAVEPDLNPYLAHSNESLYLANRILPRLAREEMPDADHPGGVRPELASWEFRDGRRTLAFTLRDGRWSNGQPVTCEDLQFTLRIQTDAQVAWRNMGLKRDIERIDCPSPRSALFRFDRVYAAQLLDANDIHVLPRALSAIPVTAWRTTDWASRLPAGGAFRLAGVSPGREVVLERNSGWYGGPDLPRLDGLRLVVVPDAATRMNQLLAGTLDLVDALEPGHAARLAAERSVAVVRRPGWSFTYAGWMTVDRAAYAEYRRSREAACARRRVPECPDDAAEVAALARTHPHVLFGDARVRRAMTLATDRQALAAALYRGEAAVPASPILAPLPEHDAALAPWPYDVERARQLLAEAGFRDTNNEGVLEREGRPFAFELAVVAGDGVRLEVARRLQHDLARVGVRVRIVPVDSAGFVRVLASRNTDAWLGGWQTSLRVDMSDVLHSRGCGTGSANFGAFSDPDADRLADQARDAVDERTRRALWHRWEAVFHEQQPYTILFRPYRLVGVAAHVLGVETILANDPLNGVEWWGLTERRIQ